MNVILGNTGLKVHRNAFGALPIQRTDKSEAVRILKRALEKGINFDDTARLYTDSEEKIGAAFKDTRDRVIIASKSKELTPEAIVNDLHTSLGHLKTDYLDIYQLHWAARVYRPGDGSGIYETMLEARQAGKIRFIGITAHSVDVALEALDSGLYDTVQYPLNYLSSDRELSLIKLAHAKGVGLLGMKALSGGLLADNLAACFAFMHQFGNVLPLWGIQTMEELEQFLALEADSPELTLEIQMIINKDRAELNKAFCRGCGYCLPCPMGIPIFDVARMELALGRLRWENLTTPEEQKKIAKAADCTNCGLCAKRCPYKLDTPRLVKENWDFYRNFVKEKGISAFQS
jgi:aryl-alcohol dehydrogenase-like predicted oxidoreductase